jgi:hypothetical protein
MFQEFHPIGSRLSLTRRLHPKKIRGKLLGTLMLLFAPATDRRTRGGNPICRLIRCEKLYT